ncbi:leucine-rich repeat-containing protein 15-like [Asterias rubens]|uniref:leucine-rich repeat-containing protein 15-like n=1 Tax=Asterias rubens TaxID=7604 RepID=UPI001455D456|nr:leucine-rich repeat-containing protein 15-like [Asterias rubens]
MALSIKYQCTVLIIACALCNSCWSCTIEGNKTCGSTCDYTDWAYDADCRRLSLTAVPRECCMCQTVDLRHNQIAALNDGDFAGYSDITYLDIEMNSMTNISRFAFNSNSRLDTLYAQFNLLTIIYTNNFAGAPNLRQLFLNNNSISEVERGAFDGNPNLEVLFLSSNHISKLYSDSFQELTKLVYLFIENNSLSFIPDDTFKGLTKLKHLSLGQNKLTNINSQMFEDLKNLRTLKLFSNRIISISLPDELPNLKHLDLFDNALKNIDNLTCFFDIMNVRNRRSNNHNLEVVYLAKNPLNCSCHLEPLQKWLIDHKGFLGNHQRSNATCYDSAKNATIFLQNENTSKICPVTSTTPLPLTTTYLQDENVDVFDKIVMPLAIASLTFSTIAFCVITVLGVLRFRNDR